MLLSNDKTQLVLMDLGSAAHVPVSITNRLAINLTIINNSLYVCRKEALALQEHCAQTCTAQFR